MRLFRPSQAPAWLEAVLRSIEQILRQPRDTPDQLQVLTVATLPTASTWRGAIVAVSNETGGFTIAFSDGTNWRRVQDRAIVS